MFHLLGFTDAIFMQRNRPNFAGAMLERQVEAELKKHHSGYHVLCIYNISFGLPRISTV